MKFRLLMKKILKILQIKLNLKCYHGKIGLSNGEFYNINELSLKQKVILISSLTQKTMMNNL